MAMISGLRGTITEKELDSITIDVGGVGYKVFVTNQVLEDLNNFDNKTEVYLNTYLSVRENALDLYGFTSSSDKQLFKLLLTISGVGPKSALNIMNSVTRDMIEESISKEDAKYLSKISGIGKKTAEKIILGLKDKMGTVEYSGGDNKSDNSLSMDALVSLGYSERDVREVMKKIDTKEKDHQDIIKEALKILGKN
jgi:Holliday junction DNA helicase RuvA